MFNQISMRSAPARSPSGQSLVRIEPAMPLAAMVARPGTASAAAPTLQHPCPAPGASTFAVAGGRGAARRPRNQVRGAAGMDGISRRGPACGRGSPAVHFQREKCARHPRRPRSLTPAPSPGSGRAGSNAMAGPKPNLLRLLRQALDQEPVASCGPSAGSLATWPWVSRIFSTVTPEPRPRRADARQFDAREDNRAHHGCLPTDDGTAARVT